MEQSVNRVEYGLHTPMPGGSVHRIEYDDEEIEVNIPPVGFTIDRIPDPKTGRPSFQLVPCEILFADKPVPDQKWVREGLPKEWKKWRSDEKKRRRTDSLYVHPDAERIRQTHWTRRINGCWMALGNRNDKPTEYYYLPGPYWHFLNWWKQDFGYPDFLVPQWEIYLALCYTYDHPDIFGLGFAGNRRGGKTSISMHHMIELPTRMAGAKAGMQAQTEKDAKKKWDESLVYGFLSQPDFFMPLYDKQNQLKKEIFLRPRLSSKEDDEASDVIEGALNSRIDYRETKSASYDGYKMHRNSFEEPGKWEEEDIDKTLRTILPTLKDRDGTKIGCTFLPTTIEDMDKGGREFIKIAENSRPSLMKRNANGKTATQIIFLFQPAYKNYTTDEYGRSVIEDPGPDEIILDTKGKRITKGAKTRLMQERDAVRHDRQAYVETVRKYPFTWEEAKMMDTAQSPFNVEILEKRYGILNGAPSYPFIKGNFNWVGRVDGEVQFDRDDVAGRWAIHINPDKYGDYFDGDNRVTNRVGFEMWQGRKFWFPKNNRLWRLGADPIRYDKTDDPRSSKAATYLWYKFDPAKDMNKPIDQWVSHNWIAQYLIRPNEFEIYGEDMIKACRYFGCSILPEPNVTNLQQHFDARGYGRFILYRKDFDETVIPKRTANDDYKGLESSDLVVDAYVSRMISQVNKHGHRILFPELIEQMINFKVKERTKFDAVVGAGYAILAGDAIIDDKIDEVEDDSHDWFSVRDSDSGEVVESFDSSDLGDFFE